MAREIAHVRSFLITKKEKTMEEEKNTLETGQDTVETEVSVEVPAGEEEKGAVTPKSEAMEAAEAKEPEKEGSAGKEGNKEEKEAPQGEAKEDDYQKRLDILEKRELTSDTRELLKENDIPDTMLPFLMQKDLETTKENVQSFKTAFDAAVKSALDKALVGKTPPAGNSGLVQKGNSSVADEFTAALRG